MRDLETISLALETANTGHLVLGTLHNLMSTGRSTGQQLLNDELARLVLEHKVDFDEALAKAVDKPDLARRCGR